jgi:hypothetical protein
MSAHAPLFSASSSSSYTPAHSSRACLDCDALSSVLSFLSLRELAAALAVNKEWSAAVLSMRPAMLPALIPEYGLHRLLSSRLRRHVGQLGHLKGKQLSMLPTQLTALSGTLPQLRSLSAVVRMPSHRGAFALPFPPQLQHLNVYLFNSPPGSNESAALLLASIGQLCQLHSLRLQLLHGDVSLVPLQQLSMLRDLELRTSYPNVEQFATELCALPWLHRMHIKASLSSHSQDGPHVPLINALLRDTSEDKLRALQWRDFDLGGLFFTDELTPLLLHLPLLERLDVNLTRCTRFDFLFALQRLLHLKLHLWYMPKDSWATLLSVFTSDALVHLQTLGLYDALCSASDLTQLLSHTPSLTSLTLAVLEAVRSLSFFHQLPKLAETLTHLDCRDSCTWTAADLQSLHVLQQLRVLRLLSWPKKERLRLTAEDRAPFEQRPCSVLPHLEVFEWTMQE